MKLTTSKNTWEPVITMSTLLAVKAEHGIDLIDLTPQGKGLGSIGTDLGKFFEVLYRSVSKEAKDKAVDFQSFVDEFTTGDQIQKAQDALMDAVFPFFKSDIQTAIRKTYDKSAVVEKQLCAEMCQKLDTITGEEFKDLMKQEHA